MDISTFTNNNIDLVVNIVAAMLGISFPFLLQAINNIDEKYNSQSIISWFSQSSSYILFKELLFVSVLILFLLIILPFYQVTNGYCVCLQTIENIVVLFLVIDLFFLSRNILSFYRANVLANKFSSYKEWLYNLSKNKIISNYPSLQSKIVKKYNDSSMGLMVNAWSEFMTYLISNESSQIAMEAYHYLSKRILRLREVAEKEVIYDDSINKAVVKLNTDLCKSQIKAFSIFSTNDLLTMFAGQYDDKVNGKSIRDTLWRCLIEQLYYDRDEMLYSNWEYASQRLSLFISNRKNRSSKEYESYIKQYKEFYIVLCSVLLMNEKYQLLSKLLFFSHSEPPEYPLVPGAFSDILFWYSELGCSPYEDNFAIESKYPIVWKMKSPFSGEQRKYIREYLALLFVRLEYTRDFYCTRNRFDLPNIEAQTPIDIKRQVDTFDCFMKNFDLWKSERNVTLNTLMSEGFSPEMDSREVLTTYKKALLDKQTKIKEEQPDSQKIIKNMQSIICDTVEKRLDLYKALLNSSTVMPEHDDSNMQDMFFKHIAYNDSSSVQLFPKEYFKDGQEIPICNLPETLADGICFEFSHGVAMQFYLRDNNSLPIHFDELEKAIDILKLDKEKYVILFFGISNPLELGLKERFKKVADYYSIDDIETWLLPYTQPYNNRMVVVRKDMMPKLEIMSASKKRMDKYGFESISGKYPLLWSLINPECNESVKQDLLKDRTAESLKDMRLLYIFLTYKIYIPADSIIRSLAICDPYSSEVSKLNELKPLD